MRTLRTNSSAFRRNSRPLGVNVGRMFRFDLLISLITLANWLAKILVKCLHPGLVSRYINQTLRAVLCFTPERRMIVCA